MRDLDILWEQIRGGDRRAARELVDYLIAEGDEEQVRAASRAIGRHFEREARDLLRRAHMVAGESRRSLTAEALEALTTAAVATRLPELIRASLANPGPLAATGVGLPGPSLPPVTELTAKGANVSVDLSWRPPSDLAVTGLEVIVYRNSLVVQRSAELAATASGYSVGELSNGVTYTFVVKTLAAGLVPGAAQVNGTAGLVEATLPAAGGLKATPANRSLRFDWSDPATGAGVAVTGYKLVLTGENLSREAKVPPADEAKVLAAGPRSYTFNDLQNGTAYTLALQTVGTVDGAADQLGETASLSAIPGVSGAPFVPRVPALTADPLLFFDRSILGEIASAEKLRAEALSIAQKWRYEYLKQKAVDAAQEALAYDRQIVELMSMALQKSLAAETQLTPVILSAMDDIKLDSEKIVDVAKAGTVEEAIESLGDAITSSVLLTAILEWMARNDALDVWIGLFDALIDDASDFDESLTRTKRFFDEQYESSAFGTAVKEVAELQLARIGPLVDAAVRPLRDAVAELIGATSEKMGAVFAAFDLPILMSDGGKVDVPNVNPLLGSLAALAAAVDKLELQLTKAIREALKQVAEGNNRALFRSFMIAYFVTPILAALAVSMAGGPTAACAITAAIAIGAQELLHKVARWVLGPLQDPVEELEAEVAKAFRALQKAIGNAAPLTLSAPGEKLGLLEDELRLIRTLLPRAFVDDLTALLGEARTLTLASGLLHALAAERALGYDHATAFDRILRSYESSFTPATLLPGGSDDGLFSGAALLRDLKRLDQDLIRMTDGRDVEITRRLSLFQLLGGIGDPMTATGVALGRFADFLRTGQAAVEIRPETLLDPVSPGMYRPIVEGVSVIGLARAPVVSSLASASGLSVTVSHSGRSSMRVRRDANASAPPIALPADLVDETSYVFRTTYSTPTFPFAPNTLEAKVWTVITSLSPPDQVTWDNIRAACVKKLPRAVGELANLLALEPLDATASSEEDLHPPGDAIDDDRATYWACQPQASATASQWITVELDASYEAISGVRLWPRIGSEMWPEAWALEVAEVDEDAAFRPVQNQEILTVSQLGREAVYVQFVPICGRFVRLRATTLTPVPGTDSYGCAVADIQVVVMNVTAVDVPFKRTAYGSPALEGHEWNLIVDGDPLTYGSSEYFGGSEAGRPWCQAYFAERSWLNRVRYQPPRGTTGDFPPDYRITLMFSSEPDPKDVSFEGSATPKGDLPVDVHLPSVEAASIQLLGKKLPQVEDRKFALQVGEVTAAVFLPEPPILSAAPIEEAVAAILRNMPWPATTTNPDPIEAAASIAATLRDGVPGQALRGLADVNGTPGALRAAYQTARNEQLSQIAKWAGARWTEDPDPNIHGLGFVQLEQTVAAGAAAFDLFPADGASGTSVVLRPGEPRNAGEKVYSPLQNLGLGGVLQIEAPGAAAALIADIILEIRMRACYDPQLAATVRANQQQRSQQIDRMVDLGALQSRVLQLGTPTVKPTLTAPRSAQFSLRTNRDRILQAAIAGAQVQKGTIDLPVESIEVDGVTFTPGTPKVAPLGVGAPFSYFGAAQPNEIALVFTRDASKMTLEDQLGKIVITPAVLGVDLALLDALVPEDVVPMLTGLAIAIIPTRSGVVRYPTAGLVSDLLLPLLPEAWRPTVDPQPLPRLSMTTPALPEAKPVPLASLWPATGGTMVVTVDVGTMIAEQELYDIIFSVTCNVPLLTAQTTSADFF